MNKCKISSQIMMLINLQNFLTKDHHIRKVQIFYLNQVLVTKFQTQHDSSIKDNYLHNKNNHINNNYKNNMRVNNHQNSQKEGKHNQQ